MEWSTVVVDSALWTVKAYAITVVVSVAVITALIRFTRWGSQWWRIASSYFDPRTGVGGLGLAGLVLLLTVFAVRMNVLFSYWYNDFYTAIQNLDEPAFWRFMRIFAVLATVHVLRALVVYLLGQTLDIRWRTHLNERLVDRWLDSGATTASGSSTIRSTTRISGSRSTSRTSSPRPVSCRWERSTRCCRS